MKSKKRYGRPALDWDGLVADIQTHGIPSNAAQTTVAPTGTIATVAGIEGYGCEPVFALAYVRHVNDNGRACSCSTPALCLRARCSTPGWMRHRRRDYRRGQSWQLPTHRQTAGRHPQHLRRVRTSRREHVRMQAAIQALMDNCISGHV